MPRGYRGVIVAIAGLAAISVAFGLGLYLASSNYPDEQRHQPYRYATDKPQEVDPAALSEPKPETLEYREPCKQPKGRDESDLCAQWRAAQAAENSAFWAKWGFGITVVGAFGLFATIIQGRMALRRAGEANKIAQTIGAHQVRAYIYIDSASIKFQGNVLHVEVTFKNTGQSPATEIEAELSPCVWIMGRKPGPFDGVFEGSIFDTKSIGGGVVGSGSMTAKSAIWVAVGEIGDLLTKATSLENRRDLGPTILVHFVVRWRDVFGHRQDGAGSISAYRFTWGAVLDGEGLVAKDATTNHIGSVEEWLSKARKAKEVSNDSGLSGAS